MREIPNLHPVESDQLLEEQVERAWEALASGSVATIEPHPEARRDKEPSNEQQRKSGMDLPD